MRPELLKLTHISPLAVVVVFLLVAAGVAVWLGVRKRRQAMTRDHLITGLGILGMTVVLLGIIYSVGMVRVNAYGAMLMLGFILGMMMAVRLGKRRGIPAERLLDLGLLILISAIIGARVMYMLITPNAGPFLDLTSVLQNGLGGLSFHGGLIGGALATIIYVYVTKLPFWRIADSVAPGIALGYAITRIGCFLNGCCYGKESGLPWAVTFPHSPDGLVANVHPTQIYASLMGFAICGILLLLSRGKSLERAGRLFMVFLALEGVERFVMEIFRRPDPGYHSGLTAAQALSLVFILWGIAGYFLMPHKAAVDDVAQPAPVKPTAAR